jgi:hypothetical protein
VSAQCAQLQVLALLDQIRRNHVRLSWYGLPAVITAPAAELRQIRLVRTQGIGSLACSNCVSDTGSDICWHDQVSTH